MNDREQQGEMTTEDALIHQIRYVFDRQRETSSHYLGIIKAQASKIEALAAEIERLKGELEAAQRAIRHKQCHDLTCSGNRDYPRGDRGHSCSCHGRDLAYQDAIAIRATLTQQTEDAFRAGWNAAASTTTITFYDDAYAAWRSRQPVTGNE